MGLSACESDALATWLTRPLQLIAKFEVLIASCANNACSVCSRTSKVFLCLLKCG